MVEPQPISPGWRLAELKADERVVKSCNLPSLPVTLPRSVLDRNASDLSCVLVCLPCCADELLADEVLSALNVLLEFEHLELELRRSESKSGEQATGMMEMGEKW